MHFHCPTPASIIQYVYTFPIYLKLIVFKMYYHSTLKLMLFYWEFGSLVFQTFSLTFIGFYFVIMISFVYHSVCIKFFNMLCVCLTCICWRASLLLCFLQCSGLTCACYWLYSTQPATSPQPYLLVVLLPNLVVFCW